MDQSPVGPGLSPRKRRATRKLAKTPRRPRKPGLESKRVPLTGKRVLVVDDDPASAKLAAVLLRSEGCEVVIARSAEEAFAVLGSFRPHAIVLDLILPLMSGLLFAQRMKADAATRAIVLIAVTVMNGTHTERLVRDAGCTAYIRKPINPVSFAECVAECLSEAT